MEHRHENKDLNQQQLSNYSKNHEFNQIFAITRQVPHIQVVHLINERHQRSNHF